jgi:hypothetical protein
MYRPDHDQQHCCLHAATVKPEASTAVVELLKMGVRTPETCWAVHKRQIINLRNCCIWLVDLFEVYAMYPWMYLRARARARARVCVFVCVCVSVYVCISDFNFCIKRLTVTGTLCEHSSIRGHSGVELRNFLRSVITKWEKGEFVSWKQH